MIAVVSPWIAANLARFGTVIQDSSAALYGSHLSPASLGASASILVFWWFRALSQLPQFEGTVLGFSTT